MSDNSFSRRKFLQISGMGAITAASLKLEGMFSVPEAIAD